MQRSRVRRHRAPVAALRRWTWLSAAGFGLAQGCGGPGCPEGWREDDADDLACLPPDGYDDDVRARLTTGLYGHALTYEGSRDEDTSCTDWGSPELASGGRFELVAGGDWARPIIVEVRADGTWEAELAPEVDHVIASPPESALDLEGVEEVDPNGSFRLRAGQVERAVARLLLSCPG